MTRPYYRDAIEALTILSHLTDFDPHIVGTPLLGLHTDESDIDILCEAADLDYFARRLWALYSDRAGFRIWQWSSTDRPIVASFIAYGWEFEIFGSTEAVKQQPGWIHFSVERRLLKLGGSLLRRRVMEHRNAGLKTEPAFWSSLKQPGNPYCGMLSLFDRSDDDLAELLKAAGFGA